MADKRIDLTEENIVEHASAIIAKMSEGFVPSIETSPRIITLHQKQNIGEYDSWIYSNDYRLKGKLKKQLETLLQIESVVDNYGIKHLNPTLPRKIVEYELYTFFKKFTFTRKEKISNLLAD